MQQAISSVERGESSTRRAAEMFRVPRATLHDYVSGKIQFGCKSGPKTYLTSDEEEELENFIIRCARVGYPHTKKQILALVQEIVDGKGIETTVSNGWWERFCARHPKVTLKSAVPLSLARAIASDPITIQNYYDELEDCLVENDILDRPAHSFNCDESNLPLNPKCPKTVNEVGAKNPSYVTGNDKSAVTVLACVSAAGYAIPPFIIFDRKTLNPQYTIGEVPGTLYGLSSNGWIDRNLFSEWFFNHFLVYAPPSRPLLLLMDGHSSHYCPEMIRAAAAEKVIMFVLPPHTTHLTQPLDKGCFGPLKQHWRRVCHNFMAKNPGRYVSRLDFSELFAEAWYQAMVMPNILASFRITGVCPFNRDAIKLPSENDKKHESLAEKSGLGYIPLISPISPARCRSTSSEVRIRKSVLHIAHKPSLNKRLSSSDPNLGEDSMLEVSSVSEDRIGMNRCLIPLRSVTSISKYLRPPCPPASLPKKENSSHRILTSYESICEMEYKEKKKRDAAREKEERRQAREEKKKMKLEEKQKKKSGKKKKGE